MPWVRTQDPDCDYHETLISDDGLSSIGAAYTLVDGGNAYGYTLAHGRVGSCRTIEDAKSAVEAQHEKDKGT